MAEPPVHAAQDDLGIYLSELHRRLAAIESETKRLIVDEHQREERIDVARASLHEEMESIGRDLQHVEDELLQMVQRTRNLVHAFKDSARTQEFARLHQRVEAWGGERFVGRDEFKRQLRKEFG